MESIAVLGLILAVVLVAIGLARFAAAWRNWRSFARGEDARMEEFVTRIAQMAEEHEAPTDGCEAVERDRIGLEVELSRRALALHIERIRPTRREAQGAAPFAMNACTPITPPFANS